MIQSQIELATKLLKKSHSILIGTGAGMGKDSGLPDFRGSQGFWNHYPPYKDKFDFYQCANPYFLVKQPNLFWGFYGSRLQMYRKAIPHQGFNILKQFNTNHHKQMFVITSNVDGLFKKSFFQQEKMYQVHGNIHHLQCQNPSCSEIIQNNFVPKIDYQKMSCQNLPVCEKCKQPKRPNILMFNDIYWDSSRSDEQQNNFKNFIQAQKNNNMNMCMIQIGCGQAIPTIRHILNQVFKKNKSNSYIRINPDKNSKYDPKQKQNHRFVHIKGQAKLSLQKIREAYLKLKQ